MSMKFTYLLEKYLLDKFQITTAWLLICGAALSSSQSIDTTPSDLNIPENSYSTNNPANFVTQPYPTPYICNLL